MVIVASRDLYQGVSITEEDLYAVQILPRYLPEGVFLSPEHVVGPIPRLRILANEFVRAEALADPETGRLSDVLPVGMRAVSVPARGETALEGGNYVDAWWTPDGAEPCAVVQVAFVLTVDGEWRSATRKTRSPPQRLAGDGRSPRRAGARGGPPAHPSFRLVLRNDLDVTLDPEVQCAR